MVDEEEGRIQAGDSNRCFMIQMVGNRPIKTCAVILSDTCLQ